MSMNNRESTFTHNRAARARRPHWNEDAIRCSDGLLVQQALTGDEDAFAALVERYQVPLFNRICHTVGDTDLAEDLLQQVFLKLYRSLPTLYTGGSLRAWLFQVAYRCCLDELRRKRVLRFSELGMQTDDDEGSALTLLTDPTPSPEAVAEQRDLQRSLLRAIGTLPPKFRAVVLLRYARQLSFCDIAQILRMPEATAKTYMQRAKPLLRAALNVESSADNGCMNWL
jgi:RNA polymerase sigma factor (sigma-70 family)